MIKATLKQIVGSQLGVQTLMAGTLPVKAKYAVAKLETAINSELQTYEKARVKCFEDAGCKVGTFKVPFTDDKGVTRLVDQSRYVHDDQSVVDAAQKEAEELLTVEVELNAFPLDLAQFGNGNIEGPGFSGLMWAIKEPTET